MRVLVKICWLVILLLLATGPRGATSQGDLDLYDVRVTNVHDAQFTVSWLTSEPAGGEVRYGTTPALGEVQSQAGESRAHHVTLTDLQADTTYYFDLASGSATDNRCGAHYTITTGPRLSIPPPHPVYGQVFQPDGVTPAAGALAFLWLEDDDGAGSPGASARMSVQVDANGWWYADVGNARTRDLNAYFSHSPSGDWLHVLVADPAGAAERRFDTGGLRPAPDITLTARRCPGYLSDEPAVTWADIQAALDQWHRDSCDTSHDPDYDIDTDGRLTVVDLQWVTSQWGRSCE